MKIKINQEEYTSPKLDALLKLDRQQQHLKILWIILPILIVLLMFGWQQHLFTAWVILPSIWMLLVFNH
jgi:hypothetical protein